VLIVDLLDFQIKLSVDILAYFGSVTAFWLLYQKVWPFLTPLSGHPALSSLVDKDEIASYGVGLE
jgi:hypothetical protein